MSETIDIVIQIPEDKKSFCEICQKQLKSPNALSGHLGAGHKVAFEDYLVKYYNNNIKPKCPICNEYTRYVRGKYSFKRYCIAHANEARSAWSKANGYGGKVDASWKKGLTKETNESIRRHSDWMKGKNNPFYGKKHTEEITKHLIESRKITSRLTLEEFETRKNGPLTICLDSYESYKDTTTRNLNYKCIKCDKTYIASFMFNNCQDCAKLERKNNIALNKKIADSLKLSEEEFNARIATRAEDFIVLTPYSEYTDHDISKLKIKCIHCDNVLERTLFTLVNGTICRVCCPYSKEEKEINEFLEANGITSIRNSRSIISPKELDFYIEAKNLAIEFNGLYWHVEDKKDQHYHLAKTENGELKFFFGDHSSHAGNFVFQTGVSGTLSKAWAWPVAVVISILSLPGDKTFKISDEGAAMITVDSGIAEYNYILPAQTK